MLNDTLAESSWYRHDACGTKGGDRCLLDEPTNIHHALEESYSKIDQGNTDNEDTSSEPKERNCTASKSDLTQNHC